MPELEKVIERKLRDGVKKLGRGAKCLKFESPGTSGVPDRMILLPGGRIVFVELKQVGKRERMRPVLLYLYAVPSTKPASAL